MIHSRKSSSFPEVGAYSEIDKMELVFVDSFIPTKLVLLEDICDTSAFKSSCQPTADQCQVSPDFKILSSLLLIMSGVDI